MPLFSPSEAVYITSFLSAVDLEASVNPDGSIDPSLADRVPQLQGREALSKATKDLMSLSLPVTSNYHSTPAYQTSYPHTPSSLSGMPSYWPSIPGSESGAPTRKIGTSGVHSSSANYLARGPINKATPLERSASRDNSSAMFSSQLPSQPQVQIAPLRTYDSPASSSGFTLPPISTAEYPSASVLQDGAARLSTATSPTSAPSMSPSTSTSAKRPLSSSQPATDPSSSKRPRPSPSTSYSQSTLAPDSDMQPSSSGPASRSKSRRSASSARSKSTTSTASGPPSMPASTSGSMAVNGAGAKGALLSPSQKRANHIQSEQKRRANIRRGYEMLCEVVPTLREAIRAEDERERPRDGELHDEAGSVGASAKGKGRAGGEKGKKKKGKAEVDRSDGRAGPRSENVVLQKTIDYITALIADRAALQQRLELARGMLTPGHPYLSVDPRRVDNGVPLWERQWNGGIDIDVPVDGAGEDEGSEDES